MKVVLIAPERPYLTDQKSLPPLGLLYVADALKKQGHEVEVLDFADGYKFVEADAYGVSVTTTDYPTGLKILRWLKEKGAKKVIAGGPHATLCPDRCLADGFDGVSVGDGELTIEQLIRDGGICERRAKDIDGFYPDRNALDLWSYNFNVCGQRASPIMSARGCAWSHCAFCCQTSSGIRFCSSEHVKKEIDQIYELGFRAIMVYDDEFFMNPERDLEIIRYMGRKGITWRAFCHSRFILRCEELIQEASVNGLKEVLIGMESGSGKILSNIDKGTTPRENAEAVRLLHRYGIRVKGAFIVGLPGESEETLGETVKFIEDSPCDDYDFSVLVPLPGSQIYKNPEAYDISFNRNDIYIPWKKDPEQGYKCCVSTRGLTSREILAARQMLEDKYKKT